MMNFMDMVLKKNMIHDKLWDLHAQRYCVGTLVNEDLLWNSITDIVSYSFSRQIRRSIYAELYK